MVGERTKLGLGALGAAATLGLLGDLLLRATPWGLNVFLWVASLVVLVSALALWRGVGFRGEGRWLAAPLVFFAALFVWRDSNTLAVINGLAALIALSLAVFRSRSGRVVVSGLVSDYFYLGLQAVAYGYAGPLPLAMRDVRWSEVRPVGYRPVLAVLRGVVISVPLLLVFGGLFVAADAVFERFVSDLFDFDLAEVMGHILLFTLFFWVSAGLIQPALLGGEFPKPNQRPTFLSLGIVELGVALGLLNALFLSFVLVQARYFFGGTDSILDPSYGLTYAEYARRGFFELVTVTALVLPLLLLAHWLLRTDKPLHRLLFRTLSGTLVGLLFVVMASALQRMRLYTAEFGLTELRLYTTAFMLWIFVVLLIFLLTVLRDRRPYFASLALVTGFLAVAALNVINPDDLIVRTNVARMEEGKRFDAGYLSSLSADAVPALIESFPKTGEERLYEENRLYVPSEDEQLPEAPTLEEAVTDRWKTSRTGWRTFNLSRSQARRLVEDVAPSSAFNGSRSP